jgi:hypothetical protein
MRHPLTRLVRHLDDLGLTLADARMGAALARDMASGTLGTTEDGTALVAQLENTERILMRLKSQAWQAMASNGLDE